MSRLSENLKRLRKEKGLTVAMVADYCGVAPENVLDWEEGRIRPDEENTSKLCALYNVTKEKLEKGGGFRLNFDNGGVNINISDPRKPEKDKDFSVRITEDGVKVGFGEKEKDMEEEKRRKRGEAWMDFPYWAVCLIGYLLMGFLGGLWHPGWLIFMTIPLYYGLVSAVVNRKANHFPYPVLATAVYLLLGFLGITWTWSLFLFASIPMYYILTGKKKRVFSQVIWPLICIAAYVVLGLTLNPDVNWWSWGWVIIFTCPIVTFFEKMVEDKN